MGQNPSRGVCPWCQYAEVVGKNADGHPGCEECLRHISIAFARCSCGTLVRPIDGLYEVRVDGGIVCCHCLGSVACGVSSCGGCDVCMPPMGDEHCHWCGAVEHPSWQCGMYADEA